MDYLSRSRLFKYTFLKYLFITILSFNYVIIEYGVQQPFCILFGILNVTAQLHYLFYSQKITRLLHVNLDLFFIWAQISQLIYEQKKNETTQFIVLIVLSTLSIKATLLIENYYQQNLYGLKNIIQMEFNPKRCNINSHDLIFIFKNIQTLLINSYDQYCISRNSQFLEIICLYHREKCQKKSECFCFYKIEDDFWQNLINQRKTHLFLFDGLKEFFEQYDKNRNSLVKDQQVHFAYCNFLIEVCNSRNLSYLRIYQQAKQQDFSFFDKMYQNYLMSLTEEKYSIIEKSTSQITAIFEFEKIQKQISLLYLQSLLKKRRVLNILNKDYINLIEFYESSQDYLNMRKQLKTTFSQMHPYCYSDPLIKEIINGFSSCLDNTHTIFNKTTKAIKNKRQYDPTKECFILIDIEKNNFGKIKKASDKSFELIFGKQIMQGQSLNSILPSEIAKVHDDLIMNYLQNLDSSKNNSNHTPLVLGINQQGFAIPLNVKFKIEINYESQMSGIIGNISLANTGHMYLMTHYDSSQIMSISKGFYENFFQKCGIRLSQTNKIYFNNITPRYNEMLYQLQQVNDKEKKINTELQVFCPNNQDREFLFKKQNHHSSKYIQALTLSKTCESFKIQMNAYQIIRESVRVLIIEITDIRKMEESEIFFELNILQEQEEYSPREQRKQSDSNELRQLITTEKRNSDEIKQEALLTQIPLLSERKISSPKKRESLILRQLTETRRQLSSFRDDGYMGDNISERVQSTINLETNQRIMTLKSPRIMSPIGSQRSLLNEEKTMEPQFAKIVSEINTKITDYTYKKSDFFSAKVIEFSSNNVLRKDSQFNNCINSINKEYSKKNPSIKIIIEENDRDDEINLQKQIKQANSTLKNKQNKRRHIMVAELLVWFSFLSMLTIATIAVIYFFKSKFLFNKQKQGLEYISWPMTLRSIASTELYYAQYIKIADKNIFPSISSSFKQKNINRVNYLDNDFREVFHDMVLSDKQEYPYFMDMIEDNINYVELKDPKSLFNVTEKRNASFFYTLQLYGVYMSFYTSKIYEVVNEEAFNNNNFAVMNGQFIILQEAIQDFAINNLSNIFNNFIEIIWVISGISISLLTVSIIINFQIRKNIQNQLILFATFSPSSLKKMITQLDSVCKKFIETVQKNNLENQILKNKSNNGLNNINEDQQKSNQLLSNKTKGISYTKSLPLISWKFILFSLFMMTLLLTQPILNSILVNYQIEECSINLHLMQNIYDMRGHIASNMFLNTALIYQRLYPKNDFYQQDYFDKDIQYFQNLNKAKITNLNEVIQQELDKQRYKQYYYDNFFHVLLKGNICEALNNYPQFMKDASFQFDYKTCNSLRDSILTKGFQVSVTYAFNMITPIYEILQDPKNMESRDEFRKWENSTYKTEEFDLFIEYMLGVVNIMKNFIIIMSNDYIDSMETIQTYLLICYCISILVIFFIGWRKLSQYLTRITSQSSQLFSFIDKQILIQNSYFHKFQKNN